MFIPYTKTQRIDKSSCIFVARSWWSYCRCRASAATTTAHICCICSPSRPVPLVWHVSAMFRAMAAEVRWVLISTSIFQGCWGPKFVSQALDLLFGCIFLHATWVGLCLGVLNPVFQLRRVGVWPLSIPYLSVRIRTLGQLNIHITSSLNSVHT